MNVRSSRVWIVRCGWVRAVVRSPGGLCTDLRRMAAAAGLLLLLSQAFVVQPSVLTGWLSGLALLALAVAVCVGVAEAVSKGQGSFVLRTSGRTRQTRRSWLGAAALTAAISVGVVQVWFRPWGAIASGDNGPPVGVAWIQHLFVAWWGTGNSLGGPNAAEIQLPWAAVLGGSHALGISGTVAEDIWISMLVAGATLAALALEHQLQIEPVPATVGALLYVLSPLVVSEGWSPLYFACMLLLAALPALVLAVARAQVRVFHGVIILAAAAPLLGYVYSNPPLCGLVIATLPAGVLLAFWLEGRRAARRAGLLLAVGLPALLLTSLYWVVPSALQLSVVASHQLAALSSWTWTESRATVRNAFWLNTTWSWAYQLYDAYAPHYRQLPLAAIRFAPAIVAFGALLVHRASSPRARHAFRTSLALAGASLVVIFLSTGTLPPGDVAFDFLYRLPFGWLLQDPGRFLIAADLAYAVLCALSLQALLRSPGLRRWFRRRHGDLLSLSVGTACLAAVLVLPAYPLLTGAVVAGSYGKFHSSHVTVPSYWPAMARFLNTRAPAGTVLTLPVDDFYQMPYRWYYGNDDFIMNQIDRPVLDPVGQGYTPGAPALVDAVTLAQQALLAGNWTVSQDVLGALGVRLLLVRGDLIFPFPGRTFARPASVATALERDPFARLLIVRGPLRLYKVSGPVASRASRYATTNVVAPDLRALAVLPPGYRLVSSHPIPGVPTVTELPLARWVVRAHSLTISVVVPSGRQAVALLTRTGARAPTPVAPGRAIVLGGQVRVALARRRARSIVSLKVGLQKSLLTDGNFSAGPWGRVGNCYESPGTLVQAATLLHAALVRGEAPGDALALRLSAGIDSACEARPLTWRSGSLLLNMQMRHVEGAPPRVCLWEMPIGRCAALPAVPSGSGWKDYLATVTPDPGTKSLTLFLYADSLGLGTETVNEYGNIRAVTLPVASPPVIVTWPARMHHTPTLTTNGQAYTSAWRSLEPARHVLVDGLTNGWLAASGVRSRYWPTVEVESAEGVAGGTAVLLVVALATERLAKRRWKPSVLRSRTGG